VNGSKEDEGEKTAHTQEPANNHTYCLSEGECKKSPSGEKISTIYTHTHGNQLQAASSYSLTSSLTP